MNATAARAGNTRQEISLWLAYLVLDTGSQLSFKWAADAAGNSAIDIAWLVRVLAATGLWLGIGCYVGTLLVWLRVLARMELSRAFPMSGLAYITVPILAIVLFGESLTLIQATGIAAICAGVVLLAVETAPAMSTPS